MIPIAPTDPILRTLHEATLANSPAGVVQSLCTIAIAGGADPVLVERTYQQALARRALPQIDHSPVGGL